MQQQKPKQHGGWAISSDAIRARQKVRSGSHMVMAKEDLQAGQITDKKGTTYSSLTKARKAAKLGDAIVRVFDGVVVSVK